MENEKWKMIYGKWKLLPHCSIPATTNGSNRATSVISNLELTDMAR